MMSAPGSGAIRAIAPAEHPAAAASSIAAPIAIAMPPIHRSATPFAAPARNSAQAAEQALTRPAGPRAGEGAPSFADELQRVDSPVADPYRPEDTGRHDDHLIDVPAPPPGDNEAPLCVSVAAPPPNASPAGDHEIDVPAIMAGDDAPWRKLVVMPLPDVSPVADAIDTPGTTAGHADVPAGERVDTPSPVRSAPPVAALARSVKPISGTVGYENGQKSRFATEMRLYGPWPDQVKNMRLQFQASIDQEFRPAIPSPATSKWPAKRPAPCDKPRHDVVSYANWQKYKRDSEMRLHGPRPKQVENLLEQFQARIDRETARTDRLSPHLLSGRRDAALDPDRSTLVKNLEGSPADHRPSDFRQLKSTIVVMQERARFLEGEFPEQKVGTGVVVNSRGRIVSSDTPGALASQQASRPGMQA
jgi:hypothetical protein